MSNEKQSKNRTEQRQLGPGEIAGIRITRIVSNIVDHAVVIILLLLLVYGAYAMWDARNIYTEADAAQYEQYKPAADNLPSFEELKQINPEVFAWLTVYGTGIDYPVAQSKDNQKYINTSIMGEYSLAGSIYLDSQNSKDFSDFNSIIYGHHMEASSMFGDLDKFMDEDFFNSHKYGNLSLNGKDYGIEFFGYLLADAYDWTIYNPGITGSDQVKMEYLSYLLNQSVFKREIGANASDRIVLLSTCAAEPTNGRHILIGRLSDDPYPDTFIEEEADGFWSRVDSQALKQWAEKIPYWGWIMILFIIILILLALITIESLHNKKKMQKKMRDEEYANKEDE